MLSLPDFRQKQIVYIECLKNKKIRFLNQNFSFFSVLVDIFQNHGISLFFSILIFGVIEVLVPKQKLK